MNIKKIYEKRFSLSERVRKHELWQILCEKILQKYINPEDVVLDLGAGHCEFINNIICKKKLAVDLNIDTPKYAAKEVKVINRSTKQILKIFDRKSIDVVFLSNFLEHLDSKEEIFRLIEEIYEILKPEGRIMIMQPDIKLVGDSYWDFFDHKVPLTFDSIKEVLRTNNFSIISSKYPFLPYSTKTFLIYFPVWLFKVYLNLGILQFIFGKQFFICAQKSQ